MFFAIRFSIYFFISFALLSIPINDKTLFTYLHKVTAPYTSQVYGGAKEKIALGAREVKNAGKRFFTGAKPQEDSIRSRYSSTQREKEVYRGLKKKRKKVVTKKYTVESDDFEKYTAEERELLKRILEQSQ
jgi:hypothetical protein